MKRVIWGISCLLLTGWILVGAAPPERTETVRGQRKPMAPANIDYQTYIDANRILMFVTNQGSFAYDNGALFGKSDGLYYPKGTDLTAIFAAGLWLGAKAQEDLRVSVAEYSHTYWPGPMIDQTFDPNAAGDPSLHVYKLYKELAINGFYDRPAPSDPDSLKRWNYYHQWPANMGAPVDAQGKPLFIGDQTLWCVYNDANPATHANSAGSSEGLGVEVQQTAFAFDRDNVLGNCVFQRYLLINKGGLQLDSVYLGLWADPDVGGAGDDYAGCDTTLNLGYAYNADGEDEDYGANPPAAGFQLLQGPINSAAGDSALFLGAWRQGYANLPMTAFTRYLLNLDPWSPQESFWYMQGRDAKNGGEPIINPVTGLPTTYMCSGDPAMQTGWVDYSIRVFQPVYIDILEVAGPGGMPVDPPDNVAYSWNITHEWYVSSDQGDNWDRLNWRGLIGIDTWELRFTAAGSEYYNWDNEQKFTNRVPFEAWNLGSEKPNDPANDRRIQIMILDNDGSGGWTPGDRTYLFEREYYEPLPQIMEYTWPDDFHIGRILFNENTPQQGTKVQFISHGVGDPDTLWGQDCRYMLASGPFNMAPGDTQEVVMAVIVGQGIDRLSSVQKLKETAALLPKILTPDFEICNCLNTGDLNDNGIAYEVADVVFMVNYLFCGGNAPPSDDDCPLVNRADFDCDGKTNLVDLVRTVYLVYRHPAPMPCDPCRR